MYERTGLSINHSVHVFKYPRDCTLFESKWNAYLNDPSDHKVFFAVINIDNSYGVLGFAFEATPPLGGFIPNQNENSGNLRSQVEYSYDDEIFGIQEVMNTANASCAQVLIGSMAVASFEREKLSTEYRNWEWYRDAVDQHLKNWSEDLSEASYTLNIYWVKELEAVRKEMGYEDCWWFHFCGNRSRHKATINVCRQVIHTSLDICGFFLPLCDPGNLVLYLQSGDLKNAAFSAIGAVPIAGKAATGIKYGARTLKIGNKVAILKFSVETTGHIHWVAGRTKLQKLIKTMGIQQIFNGVQLTYNSAVHNAHHLIPWSLVDKATTQHKYLMQQLARAGWHPSNPIRNGLIIPQKLPNGNTFHGSHEAYNTWVRNALDKISNAAPNLSRAQLSLVMDDLTIFLKLEIEKAYKANRSIQSHFRNGHVLPYELIL